MSDGLRTASEAKAERIAAMGSDVGEIHDALWQRLASLHHLWDEYVVLFGSRESRVDLLNQAAPGFSGLLQDSLWDGVLLGLSRLTDSPRSVGKENLTVRRLEQMKLPPELWLELQPLIAKSLASTEFCRDWRNRRLAHGDLQLALDPAAKPLQVASRLNVRAALADLSAVSNAIATHYSQSPTHFDECVGSDGALSLLFTIEAGLRSRQETRKRLSQGQGTAEDLVRREI